MAFWAWIAAVWLATAALITATFFAARRSRVVYRWLFGQQPAPEVTRLAVPPKPTATAAGVTRLAA